MYLLRGICIYNNAPQFAPDYGSKLVYTFSPEQVRLLLEVGANHNAFKPSVHVSIVFLDDIASTKVRFSIDFRLLFD